MNLVRKFAPVRQAGRPRVRVSFDIDDTLACHYSHRQAEQNKLPAFINRWLGEPLHVGSRALIRELRRRGYSIWIYTSSGRSPIYIRRWLLLHGIHVDGIVNSGRHRDGLAANGFVNSPSKYPPAFGIDVHIDDSEGVHMEGKAHGFRVVVVCPKDEGWTQRVLDALPALDDQLAQQNGDGKIGSISLASIDRPMRRPLISTPKPPY